MVTGLLILTTVALLGVLSHRRTKLEEKVYKNIPLTDWINLLALPVGLFLGWVLLVRHIIDRPNIPILLFDDFDNLFVTMLFMIYGFVGLGIHFTAKILWRYLKKERNSMAFRINEIFHNKFSHYLAYLNGLLILFMLSLLEINHPSEIQITFWPRILIILIGFTAGASIWKSIAYTDEWFGGYNKPLFFIVFILLALSLNLSRILRLSYSYYPVRLFIVAVFGSGSVVFIVRQILIFTKLSQKKRWRFLSRVLNI